MSNTYESPNIRGNRLSKGELLSLLTNIDNTVAEAEQRSDEAERASTVRSLQSPQIIQPHEYPHQVIDQRVRNAFQPKVAPGPHPYLGESVVQQATAEATPVAQAQEAAVDQAVQQAEQQPNMIQQADPTPDELRDYIARLQDTIPATTLESFNPLLAQNQNSRTLEDSNAS